MVEKLWYIKRCDLFADLSEEQLQRLEAHCRIRDFGKGLSVYLPTELAHGVFLLASGRVKICSFTEGGKQLILAFIEPGELFGELSLVGEPTGDEYAEAMENSTVVFIPSEIMRRLVEETPQVSLGITKLIGLRRRRIERRLKYLLFRSNTQRLANLLLELAEQYGERASDGIQLRIRLSHQELASVIGSTRETVTVLLGEFQERGCIRRGRRTIVVTDLGRLTQIAQQESPSATDNT